MGGGIFLLSGEELVAMHEQPYDSEDLLQTLLAKYPELIAGEPVAVDDPAGLASCEARGRRSGQRYRRVPLVIGSSVY